MPLSVDTLRVPATMILIGRETTELHHQVLLVPLLITRMALSMVSLCGDLILTTYLSTHTYAHSSRILFKSLSSL